MAIASKLSRRSSQHAGSHNRLLIVSNVVCHVAVGNVGRADDAYCDVGGVLNDLAVAKVSSIPFFVNGFNDSGYIVVNVSILVVWGQMLMGDLEDAHKDLNRAMFM